MRWCKGMALVTCILTTVSLCVSVLLSQWILSGLLFFANTFAVASYNDIRKL